jgi:sec-independent protein translocase protein TatB
MPGFGDSAFIVILALLLFGPKKLPVLARQLGKLMGDFRRASNEFRTQMEEELRISEQADRQKEIAAIEAAAPVTPALEGGSESESPHLPPAAPTFVSSSESESESPSEYPIEYLNHSDPEAAPDTVPIATSGELSILPPSTGLPIANTPGATIADTVPTAPAPESPHQIHAESGETVTPPAEPERPAVAATREAEYETETLHG